MTKTGQYLGSDGDRGHILNLSGVRIVIFPGSRLVSMNTPDSFDVEPVGTLPSIAEISTSNTLATYVALLPAGARNVSMQLDPPTGSASTGQGLVTVRQVPGSPYDVAAVGAVPGGSSSLVMHWSDKLGKAHTWSTR